MHTGRLISRANLTALCLWFAFAFIPKSIFAQASPSISQQPQSQNVIAGSNAIFTVTASGQSPLSYRWSFNSTNLTNSAHIAGATAPTLTISNITVADAGNYQVTVSNNHGTATSSNALLTVGIPPGITAQPTNQTVYETAPVTFAVTATGTTPLSFQWFFNESLLPGQTNPVFSIAATTTNQTGNYWVLVTNLYGSIRSSNAALFVLAAAPAITTQPQSQSVLAGLSASFSVTLSGKPPLSYQWTFNGGPLTDNARLTGSTSPSLGISNLVGSDTGNYQLIVSNSFGTGTSTNATLVVLFTNHTHYVNLNSTNPLPPYGDWTTAATTIQDAVDAAVTGDQVIVTNGIYSAGNRVTSSTANCVVVTNAISLASISGPAQTVINGGGTKRCLYLADGASVTGFTLTNGVSSENGGGVTCESTNELLANCILTGNNGNYGNLLGNGGGAFQGTLTNCLLTGNYGRLGGGACASILYNCIVSTNSGNAAGVSYCTVNNCTLIGNQADANGGGAYSSTLSNSVLIANSGYFGGGAAYCTLYSCTLSNNSGAQWAGNAYQSTLYGCFLTGGTAYMGGGAKDSTLYDCTLSNNLAQFAWGGGAHSCTLSNCLLIGNLAGDGGGGAEGSTLISCMIISNGAPFGGGIEGGFATNCVLIGNSANDPYTGGGGGANGGSLYNCLLAQNSSVLGSGGAVGSTLVNCTVTANSANGDGGGVTSCAMTNCIVYYNTSRVNGNYSGTNYMSYSCTVPLPSAGPGDTIIGISNISAAPHFADPANANYHLYPGSPGIDVGNNTVVPAAVDLDGNSRIVNGTVDLGAYEFQNSPFIGTQPVSQTVPLGQPTVSFSVLAVGPGTLSYQWLFNGTNILGATNSTFILNQVKYSDAGTYSVIVINSFGSTRSSNAILTVVPPTPPSFATQPSNQTVAVGTNVTWTVLANGAPAPSYQWYFNGTALADNSHYSGTASGTLQILNAQTNDNGPYFVIATNVGGSTTSYVATLSVLMPPSVVQQPQNLSVLAGATASFTATADGSAPLGYQWFFNGTPLADSAHIAGSGTTSLSVLNAQFADSGNYLLVVTNVVGIVTSTAAVLTVLAPPQISQSPTDQNVLLGSNAVFSATAIGTQPISYQWFFSNSPLSDAGRISGSTNSSLAISGVQTNDSGPYFVVATNSYGASTSSVGNLTVWLPVSINQQPSNQIAAVGSNVLLTATAAGTGPFGYQWYFNNTALTDTNRITGSLTSSLTISNAQPADTGNYFVVATNLLSSSTSATATVTILTPPTITTQPAGRSMPLGLSNFISAAASGSGPLSFQWRLNGADIPGATNTSYSIPAVGTNNLGYYQFVASNAVGVAASGNAWLTLGPVAAWGYNVNNQCLVPPWLTNVTSIAGGFTFSLASLIDGTIAAWGSVGVYTNSTFTNVDAVAAGANGVAVLRSDGTVVGSANLNPTAFKVYPSNIVAIAAGFNFGLGLRAEGTVLAWGEYSPATVSSPVLVPPGLTKVTAIAAGYSHSLALRNDGTVVAWGSGPQTNVPAGLSNVVAIAAGQTHSLALKSDGHVVAWGTGAGINVPANLSNVVSIAAGGYPDQRSDVSFAVRSNETLVAWGISAYPQTNTPIGLSNVVAVADGTYHTLALVNDGKPQILQQPVGATAWSGRDWTLQVKAAGAPPLSYQWLFNGTNIDGATNTTLLLPAIQSTNAGSYQVVVSNALGLITSFPAPLAVTDSPPFLLTQPATNFPVFLGSKLFLTTAVAGSAPAQYQWLFNGTNIAGATNSDLQLAWGNFSAGTYNLFVTNAFGSVLSSNITVKVLGPVVVWGNNIYGLTNVPPSASNAVAIAAGAYHNVALKADGTVIAWGNNGSGQTNVPIGLSNVVEVAANPNACLALLSNGKVAGWGFGSGVSSNALVTLSNIVSIETDSTGSTFLRPDGSLARANGTTFTYPANASNIVSLAPFDDGYIALRADGTMFVTGSGFPPPPSNNVMAVASARYQGLLVRRDGSVIGWGQPTNLTPPVANCLGVAASSLSKLAIRADGTVATSTGSANGDLATNVPPGLANVGVLDAGYTHGIALLIPRSFPPAYLSDALNTSALVVSSKASAQWFGQTNISHDEVSAVQSAPIGNNTASSMRLWLTGPINISFWWKVSSASNHGVLAFASGGVVLTNISGELDWHQCYLSLPPGNQILQWTYSKDGSPAAGQDAAWVDQIVFTPSPPVLTLAPRNQTIGAGSALQLTVTAASLQPLTYQWQLNGSNIAGATSSSLALNAAQWTDAGLYAVVVSNSVGSVTSSPTIVNVAPKIFAQASGSGLMLTWGGSFILQSATNPFGPYSDLPGALSPFLQDTSAGGQQFFRLRSQPFSLTLTPTNGGVSINGAGISGFNFYILASTNLTDWTRVSTNPSPFNFTDTNSSQLPSRFYRALLVQ